MLTIRCDTTTTLRWPRRKLRWWGRIKPKPAAEKLPPREAVVVRFPVERTQVRAASA